jgi:hypothetical protein
MRLKEQTQEMSLMQQKVKGKLKYSCPSLQEHLHQIIAPSESVE